MKTKHFNVSSRLTNGKDLPELGPAACTVGHSMLTNRRQEHNNQPLKIEAEPSGNVANLVLDLLHEEWHQWLHHLSSGGTSWQEVRRRRRRETAARAARVWLMWGSEGPFDAAQAAILIHPQVLWTGTDKSLKFVKSIWNLGQLHQNLEVKEEKGKAGRDGT